MNEEYLTRIAQRILNELHSKFNWLTAEEIYAERTLTLIPQERDYVLDKLIKLTDGSTDHKIFSSLRILS